MHTTEKNNQRPTYEELEAICRDLQSKVAKNIVVQQELIEAKNELDKDLNRFKLVEAFGREGLFQEDIKDFGILAVEYFIQAFEQPHCLIAEYNREEKQLNVLASFGFEPLLKKPRKFHFDESFFETRESCFLQQSSVLKSKLSFLELVDALVSPFFNYNGKFSGLVICGQMEQDRKFYTPIDQKDRYPFTVMTHKAGTLLQNFRVNEDLKNEILERKKIEAQLALKAEDLLRSNEDLEQFAYVASHDLKAPLRNIASFAQLLRRRHASQLDETGKEYLEFIFRGIRRFNDVIEDLLQYSRTSRASVEFEKVALNDVLDAVKERIANIINECHGSITYNGLPEVYANQSQMEQLFQNLISNALKFTPSGRKPEIKIEARPNGQYYLFEIKDNGIGIEKEFFDKIFTLFQRLHVDEEYDGTGLGLSICKKIVERHKGKIWVESDGKGKGASFFFTLPYEK